MVCRGRRGLVSKRTSHPQRGSNLEPRPRFCCAFPESCDRLVREKTRGKKKTTYRSLVLMKMTAAVKHI